MLLIKSKKGMTMQFMVTKLILPIIAFILISFFVAEVFAKAGPKEEEIICHESIDMRARTVINVNGALVGGKIKAGPVICKTIVKKITGDRESLLEEVADSMARCWWMFGEGRYEELLHEGDLTFLPGIFGMDNSDNKCFNCYTLLVDQDEIEGGPIGPTEIMEYMNNKNYPKFANVTYLDYIQYYGGPGRVVFTAPSIAPRQGYSVSMMPKLQQEESSFWGTIAKVVIGTVVVLGVVAGAVCIIATSGACMGLIMLGTVSGGAAGTAGATVLGASITVVSAAGATGTAVVGGIGAYTAYQGYREAAEKLFDKSERDVSSVYFSFVEIGEKKCGDDLTKK